MAGAVHVSVQARVQVYVTLYVAVHVTAHVSVQAQVHVHVHVYVYVAVAGSWEKCIPSLPHFHLCALHRLSSIARCTRQGLVEPHPPRLRVGYPAAAERVSFRGLCAGGGVRSRGTSGRAMHGVGKRKLGRG